MPRGGMVHALNEIHRLLRPGGTLIEIHPVHGAWVEAGSDAATPFVEADPGFDCEDEIRPTENAVRAVLERGLFVREADREFDFLVDASSVRELRDYFAMVDGYDEGPASPRVVYLRDQLYRRAQRAMDGLGTDARVVYRERARISRLLHS